MPIWRVTLKMSRFFPKGSAASRNSLGKHLPRYMDKSGKNFASLGGGTEARSILPDDARLHIILFPTTRSGSPLYINNTQSANLTEHHQTELIAMANIAAEMYWREHLGIEYQTQEYQERLQIFPESEPPLPGLNDYVRKRRPQTLPDKRPVKPKFDLRLVTKNTLEDTAWQRGQKMTLKKLPQTGLRRLTSRVMIRQVFGKLAPSIWKIIHDLSKKPTRRQCSAG